jgi:hypothetical protein
MTMRDMLESQSQRITVAKRKWEECGMIGAQTMVPDMAMASSMDLAIPENMGIAHRAVLYDLWEVLGMGGTGGKTARNLVERLTAHFTREEEIIGSIFSLAGPDGAGPNPMPEEEDIVVMTAFLESELCDLRAEHDELRPDIRELVEVAEASYDQGLFDLGMRLEAHLSVEEEVHYPAALYIGRRLIGGAGGIPV